MTSVAYVRLLSMPAFEGLRVLRERLEKHPDASIDATIKIIGKVEANSASFDLEAAAVLHRVVPHDAPHAGVEFYRYCLSGVLNVELPAWAKLITLGRGRFIARLAADEFRDIQSIFRQARLLDDPPSLMDIRWWDEIQARVRLAGDAERMERARQAELLSLQHERKRLRKLGSDAEPKWMAIDDNTVGYDILSYSLGQYGPINRLIEVKSTIASPVRFYLSRNEWEQAEKFGDAYVFHVWNLQLDPPMLYEKTVEQIRPHIPSDNEKGKWKNVQIPVGI